MAAELTNERIEKVREIFARIDRDTAEFASASGLKCPPGCGRCCYTSTPEIRPVELLPLAKVLFETGKADEFYARAKTNIVCAAYEADPQDPERGRCGVYADRPGLCRLFGFAAVRDKAGNPDLAACVVHKDSQGEAVNRIRREITRGARAIPALHAYDQEFWNLDPSSRRGMPINEALVCALQAVAASLFFGDAR